ncbi:MAG: sigma-70 family RNA polymerase sigma factor [Flavobacteriales bacterium]|nr:sigma-70 family RNA polymerase sigma factor [Flavobacteriales bacterium]MCB9178223.1 sigma-70 family RNA polymerase sigma factor [Flavobacteriales bacterium]
MRDPVTEHSAIAATLSGDTHAFAWLVQRYQHMVHTICFRILKNTEEAEEATQDSFIKAHQHLDRFQGTSRFSTWLYSIAYRTAISHLRKRGTTTLALEHAEALGPASLPEQGLDREDRRTALNKALDKLAPEDAALISLFYLQERSVEEIVTVTGVSASNVKVKLHRLRKRLLELLQNELKEEAWTLIES